MRIPAVAIATAFAGGILLGEHWGAGAENRGRVFVASVLLAIFFLIMLAMALALRGKLRAAVVVCAMAWVALGAAGARITAKVFPAEHVLRRIANGQLDLKTPLRWHGRLREEPARLPWGVGMELELESVETAAGTIPVTGGLRLGYTPKEGEPPLAEVHAGDEVAVLAQARRPQVFRDAGAFDRREYLAQQNVYLQATLRSSSLLERTASGKKNFGSVLARWRGKLREKLDAMFPDSPRTAGILRAMLLGDRSFVDRAESADFQKTGVFHVLVVAGLHVGALAFFLYWLGRKLRAPRTVASLAMLVVLVAYIAVVEQRAPVLRAGLMTGIVVLASLLYRRLEILNCAGLAALALLVIKPAAVLDTSFQLSFLAIGCIAGVAVPWMERWVQPYLRALRGWKDTTRDGMYSPREAQFRLDLRGAMGALTRGMTNRGGKWFEEVAVRGMGWTLRGTELVAVSVILQVGMLPLMARDFHRVTLLGPAANLFAVPLTGVIVPLGFFALGGAVVAPGMAKWLGWPLGILVELQGRVVGWFAGVTRGSYRIPGPPLWVMLAFFASGVLLVLSLRTERAPARWVKRAASLGLLATTLLIALHPFAPVEQRGSLEVDVLDVAQGDSILVISPRGSTLLIDGGGRFGGFRGKEEAPGPEPGEEAVSAFLWSRGIKKLDAVMLTHAHQDHIGGLEAVLGNFQVGRLWIGKETATPALRRLERIAEEQHAKLEHEMRGESFDWDGVKVNFLWPESLQGDGLAGAKNNDSLVVRLQFGDRSILLPGDAEKQAEYAMVSELSTEDLHADVLKVGHHGSKNSTTEEFLRAVGPEIGIISAGEENPYGHPSAELLARLEAQGVRTLRTDELGAVRIVTDGKALRVSCFLSCEKNE